MKRILIAYTTNAGSTEDVAREIAAGIASPGDVVEVQRLEGITTLDGWDAVVVGAPMILGWSRAAVRFVQRHRQELASKQVGYFCTAMALTATQTKAQPGWPHVFTDPDLPCPPKNPGQLSIKEAYATLSNYLRPVLKAAPEVKPLSVAMLGGKLEYFRLKWWQMLFVIAIIQASPGDRRNLPAMREWAGQLRAMMG